MKILQEIVHLLLASLSLLSWWALALLAPLPQHLLGSELAETK